MLRLSVNILTSAITLLERLNAYQSLSLSELIYLKISSINVEDLFDFSQKCGWVYENENIATLTNRGIELLALQANDSPIELKREMLTDYIVKHNPTWANRIPYGRREATIFTSSDERACLAEAGLLSKKLDIKIITWWDNLANQIRLKSQQYKNDIGRLGEEKTINYEKKRTNTTPYWISIDTNLAGYDIKSQVSTNDPTPLLIEVKTSHLDINQAMFYITSHEWNTAITSPAYVFHLWSLSPGQKSLAILSPEDLFPYIPTNNLSGEWESMKIPFISFKQQFINQIC